MSGQTSTWRKIGGSLTAAVLVVTGLGVVLPVAVPTVAAADVTFTVDIDQELDTAKAIDCTDGLPTTPCSFSDAVIAAQLELNAGRNPEIAFAAVLFGQTIIAPTCLAAAPTNWAINVPDGRLLEITGNPAGPRPNITGCSDGRLFDFTGGALRTGAVRFSGVNLENGALQFVPGEVTGAGIRSTIPIELIGVVLDDFFVNGGAGSTGGVIYTTADLLLDNVTMSTAFTEFGSGGITIVGATSDLAITQSTLTGLSGSGAGTARGGAIHCDGCASVTINNSTFSNNFADAAGGSIAIDGSAPLVVVGTVFTTSTAGVGGAIAVQGGGDISFTSTDFTDNTANSAALGGAGGGLWVDGAATTAVTLVDVDAFLNETLLAGGGAMWLRNVGTVDVTDSSITDNQAIGDGAGLGIVEGNNPVVTITGSTISRNVGTAGIGGGLYCDCDSLDIVDSSFIDNRGGSGAGAYADVFDLSVTRANFQDNRTNSPSGNGGGLTVAGLFPTVGVLQSVFRNNFAAGNGAGMACNTCGQIDIARTLVRDNQAGNLGEGGGLYLRSQIETRITNSTITGNRTADPGPFTGAGGVVLASSDGTGSAVLDRVTVAGNTGGRGAVALDVPVPLSVTIRESILANNAPLDCRDVTYDDAGTSSILELSTNCTALGGAVVQLPFDPQLGVLGPNDTTLLAGDTLNSGINQVTVDTWSIGPDSPAEGAGTCLFRSDGRNLIRPVVGCDLGAYEFGAATAVALSVQAAAAETPNPLAAVPIDLVPPVALNPAPLGANDPAGTPAAGNASIEKLDLRNSPLRNIPLRNIGLDNLTLSDDVLASLRLSQIPLDFPQGAPAEAQTGWQGFLDSIGSPLADQPLNTITLLQVLRLPEADQLDFDQLDLSDTPLGSLPVGAVAFAGATLTGLDDTTDWCAIIADFTSAPCGPGEAIDPATTTLVGISLEGVPLRNIPLRNIPLRNIPLRNIDLDNTPLRNIPLRNIPLRNIELSASPLRNIPLRNIPLRNIGDPDFDILAAPLRNIPLRNIPLRNITVDGVEIQASPLRNIPLRNIPLRNIPLRNIPLRNIPLRNIGDIEASPLRNIPLRNIPLRNIPLRNIGGVEASPLRNIPLRNIDLQTSPLRNIPLRNIDAQLLPQIVDCTATNCLSPTLTLGQAGLLPGAFLGLLADALPDDTDLGVLGDVDFSTDTQNVFTLEGLIETLRLQLPTERPYSLGDIVDGIAGDQESTFGDIVDALFEPGADLYTLEALLAALPEEFLDVLYEVFFVYLQEVEPPVSLADLLLGLLEPGEYPWEELDLAAAADGIRTAASPGGVPFEVVISTPLPAGLREVTITLPTGFTYVPGSLELPAGTTAIPPANSSPGDDPVVVTGNTLSVDLNMPAISTAAEGTIRVSALLPITAGPTEDVVATVAAPEWAINAVSQDGFRITDAPEPNDTPEDSGADLSNAFGRLVLSYIGTATDTDWYRFTVNQGEQLSIILSNLPDDYDLLLFGPAQPTLRGTAVRQLTPAADNGLSLLGEDNTVTAQIAADVDTTPPPASASNPNGWSLVEGSARRGVADERIDTGPLPAGTYAVKVTGYNGANSNQPYVLRTRTEGVARAVPCAAVETPIGGPLPIDPTATTLTPATDTLVLIDTARLARGYGAAAAEGLIDDVEAFVAALAADPTGFAGTRAAVLDLATVSAVRAANASLDASPCTPERSNQVVAAIGDVIDDVVASPDGQGIENLVIIGADDQIPMARLRDNTPVHNEREYASTFRAASPVAASQSLGFILSDDPYGTFEPAALGAEQLFVPELSVGRLVETPGDISRALTNFTATRGRLDPQTALSTGYDFLEDGARAVRSALSETDDDLVLTSPVRELISTGTTAWDRPDLVREFSQAGPDIASINAHFSHFEALPARQDADKSIRDLFSISDIVTGDTSPLKSSIIFSMGCHSGLSVSDVAVGSLKSDWAQTFGAAGAAMYAGNTGYGYGDTKIVAFTEELMRTFAKNLGDSPTIGAAMATAKQSYVNSLAVISPFEAKVSSQVVFYGLPMYRVGDPEDTGEPDFLTPAVDPRSSLLSADIALDPNVVPENLQATGETYFNVDGEVQATPYQPVQPRTTVDVTAENQVARGAIITSMISRDVRVIDPVVVTPLDDSTAASDSGEILEGNETPLRGALFPSTLQSVSRVRSVTGDRDQLVVVPGQFRGLPDDPDGRGVQRVFEDIAATVFYAPANNTDTTPARIDRTSALVLDGRVVVDVTLLDDDAARVVVLYAPAGQGTASKNWSSLELLRDAADPKRWIGSGPAGGATTIDYFIQVVDRGGNVSVSSDKGANFSAEVVPPPPPPDPEAPAAPEVTLNGAAPVGRYDVAVAVNATVAVAPGAPAVPVELTLNGSPITDGSVVSQSGVYRLVATTPQGGRTEVAFVVDLAEVIARDEVAPTVAADAADGSVAQGARTITLTASDDRSGVARIVWSSTGAVNTPSTVVEGATVAVVLGVGGFTTVRATAVDGAGNVSAVFQATYGVSLAAPTAAAVLSPAPNAAGWNNTSVTVTVTGTATDLPIRSVTIDGTTTEAPSGSTSVVTEGGTVVTYIATDIAGRSSAPQTITVRIDRVPPVVSCPSPTPTFLLNQAGRTVTGTVDGGLLPPVTVAAPTTSPGLQQVTVAATDQAGNVGTAQCPYYVRYQKAGFFEPITPNTINRANAGRNIPVKWRLTDSSGAPVATPTSFERIGILPIACGAIPVDDIEQYTDVSVSTLQYQGNGNWQYNWKTDRSLRGCYAMRVFLADDTSLLATFNFR